MPTMHTVLSQLGKTFQLPETFPCLKRQIENFITTKLSSEKQAIVIQILVLKMF